VANALADLLAVLLVLVVLRGSPRLVLAVLGASVLVLPGPLVVPHGTTSLLTFPHLVTLAGAGRLVVGLLDGSLTRQTRRITPVQWATLGLLAVTAVVGVLLAPGSAGLDHAANRLVGALDHVVFLTVAVVMVRQSAPRAALEALGLGLLLGVGVAALEHLTGVSFGRVLFQRLGAFDNTPAAFPLSLRDGAPRVRAGTEFALQFAWIAATMAPALLLVAWRRVGAWIALAAGALVLLTVYWSYSRTALAATALALLVMTVVLSRRLGLWVLVTGVLLGGGAVLTSATVRAHLDPNTDIGSVHERTRRLGAVMDVASHHPFRGVGLGNLAVSGFQTTDFAFLIAYVETGVLGALAVIACLLVAGRSVLPAWRLPAGAVREEGVAAFLGVVVFLASCVAYDAFTLVQGTHALWLAVAAGTVLVEQSAPAPVATRRRAGLVAIAAAGVAGLAAGVVVYARAPEHAAQAAIFTTLSPAAEAADYYDPVTPAQRYVHTVCGLAQATRPHGVKLECNDSFRGAGVGVVRVQGEDGTAVRGALANLTTVVHDGARLTDFRLLPTDPLRTGRPTWARTAPLWGVVSGMVLALLLTSWSRPRPAPERRPRASGASAGAPGLDGLVPAAARGR
jgi:hypothetical protein